MLVVSLRLMGFALGARWLAARPMYAGVTTGSSLRLVVKARARDIVEVVGIVPVM